MLLASIQIRRSLPCALYAMPFRVVCEVGHITAKGVGRRPWYGTISLAFADYVHLGIPSVTPYGQNIKTVGKSGSYPTRRSLVRYDVHHEIRASTAFCRVASEVEARGATWLAAGKSCGRQTGGAIPIGES
jgi:hypothetical protein